MPAIKRTYAAFLLIIFSVITFHDLVPHAHHDHDDSNAQTVHHQDHHDDDCSSILGVVGHMLHLHHHSHSDCEIDVCPEVPAIKQNNRDGKVNPDVLQATLLIPDSKPELETGKSTPVYHYNIEDALLKGISLRGPPSDDC